MLGDEDQSDSNGGHDEEKHKHPAGLEQGMYTSQHVAAHAQKPNPSTLPALVLGPVHVNQHAHDHAQKWIWQH
jgi:hypothetical protein